MISFLDLFKWDRFVATSVIELLFWLLAAIAVLFGVSALIDGVALVSSNPVAGLLAIAVSIVGALAGIVAARVVCEAVIMVFRVNENLMDIRDNLSTAVERQLPSPGLELAEAPGIDDRRLTEATFAVGLENALAGIAVAAEEAPAPVPAPARSESRWVEPHAPEPRVEPRSSETGSLEARLADIRSRRESASTSGRGGEPAPAQLPGMTGSVGRPARPEDPAAPKWEGLKGEAKSASGKPEGRTVAASIGGDAIAEPKTIPPKIAPPKVADPKGTEAISAEPKRAEAKVLDDKSIVARIAADLLVDDPNEGLAAEAGSVAGSGADRGTTGGKPKTDDAA